MSSRRRHSMIAVLGALVVMVLIAGIVMIGDGGNDSNDRSAEVAGSTPPSTSSDPTTSTIAGASDPSTPSASPSASTSADTGGPIVAQAVIDDLADSSIAPVIVSFDARVDGTDEERAATSKELTDQMLAALPQGSWSAVGDPGTTASVSLTIDAAALDAIRGLGNVSVVEANRRNIRPIAAPDVQVKSRTESTDLTPSSINSFTSVGGGVAWTAGARGDGSVVAVIDTGVDANHPWLKNGAVKKTIAEACFATPGGGYSTSCPGGVSMLPTSAPVPGSAAPCPKAGCDHGTHVAGIVAGGDGPPVPSGVAPDADLIGIQVFTYDARPNSSADAVAASNGDINDALQWVYNKRAQFPGLSAINMSLGDGVAHRSQCDAEAPSTTAKIEQLLAVGIHTVVASGNDGWTDAVSWPACISSAIAVGAVDDTTGSTTWYSNDGAMVDVMAPGTNICSSVPNLTGGTTSCANIVGGKMYYKSGTSMATPAVAGALALLRSESIVPSQWLERLQRVASGDTCVDASGFSIPTLRVDVALGLSARSALPCAPRSVSAQQSGNGRIMVSWSPPISAGSTPITSYAVTPSIAIAGCTGTPGLDPSATVSCLVTGVPSSTPVEFTVRAMNTAGQSPASTASEPVSVISGYVSIDPARIMDTRTAAQGGNTVDGVSQGGGAIGAGLTRNLKVTGRAGVPLSNVRAVALNVTAITPTASGYLTVFPAGATRPNASNLNFQAGEVTANMVITEVSSGGYISLFNFAGSAGVAVDIVGWFASWGDYRPIVPQRFLDTRTVAQGGQTFDGQFQGTGPIGANGTLDLQISGRILSLGVGAVALNVTVATSTAGGYLTVYPTGATRPTASNLNFLPGETVPNMVIAKVGAGGRITLYNLTGATQVIVDVVGWFPVASEYTALVPARIMDTRIGGDPILGGSSRDLTVLGRGGVPASGVTAVALNVTAVIPDTGGYLTVYPAGTQKPNASNINFTAGQTIPNMVIAKVGVGGKVSIYDFVGSTNVVVDVVGWFP